MTAPQAAPAPTGAPGHVRLATDGSTHHVAGDAAARADGSMIWLEHGEERRYETVFRFTRS
jgi:hypothetical protein